MSDRRKRENPQRTQCHTRGKKIVLGAFGILISSVDVFIGSLAHGGALKNPDRIGQSNYKAAYGATHWWFKRRWSRLAVIAVVASRHNALRYAGGSAQRQAATHPARAQDSCGWRFDDAPCEHVGVRIFRGYKPASAPNEKAANLSGYNKPDPP